MVYPERLLGIFVTEIHHAYHQGLTVT